MNLSSRIVLVLSVVLATGPAAFAATTLTGDYTIGGSLEVKGDAANQVLMLGSGVGSSANSPGFTLSVTPAQRDGNSGYLRQENRASVPLAEWQWATSDGVIMELFRTAAGGHLWAGIIEADEMRVLGRPVALGSWGTSANGDNAAAFGLSTVAEGNNQFVVGQFNITNPGDALFTVGNGTSEQGRSNAFVVNRNGSGALGNFTFDSPRGQIGSHFDGGELNLVAGAPGSATRGAQIRLGGGLRGDGDRNALIVLQNGAEKMRVQEGGHVGIGTSNPQAELHVQGDALFTGDLAVVGSRTTFGKFSSHEIPGLQFDYVDSWYGWMMNKANRWGGAWVWQHESPQGATTQMYVDMWNALYLFDGPAGAEVTKIYLNPIGSSYLNGGNLGLGTATPEKKLHVVGDVKVDGVIRTTGRAGDIKMFGEL